jgi:prepilin-type N-terminal cleavage/methylation domain-containing protein
MQRSKCSGFTLIELMIVVAIIAIVSAIAVPTLLSSRAGAQVSAVKAILRTITSGEQTYYAQNGSFTDMQTLHDLNILDSRFGSDPVEVYTYSISVEILGGGSGFLVTATPSISGAPTLTVDETYEIKES